MVVMRVMGSMCEASIRCTSSASLCWFSWRAHEAPPPFGMWPEDFESSSAKLVCRTFDVFSEKVSGV